MIAFKFIFVLTLVQYQVGRPFFPQKKYLLKKKCTVEAAESKCLSSKSIFKVFLLQKMALGKLSFLHTLFLEN